MKQMIKDIFYINSDLLSEKTERLRFHLILLFVFVLPYPIFYSNIILFLIIGTTLLDISKEKLRKIPKQIWIFQVIYILAVVGYFYSSHRSAAGFLLERQLAIVIFPLIIPLAIEITERRKRIVLHVFTLSCVISICFLFIKAFIVLRELNLPFSDLFSQAFFNHQFSAPLEIHAGYLSLYVTICAFHLLQLLMENKSKKLKSLLILCLLILIPGLFFLASRNTLISALVIMIFVFPVYFIHNKIRYIIAMAVFLILCFFAINNVSYLKNRFTLELVSDISLTQGMNSLDGAEPRIERWKGAYSLFKKSPVYGYGTGDEIPMLKTEYIKKNLYISYLEEFNAHNQYLSYLLKNGAIGLLIFLSVFTYFGYLAIHGKDFIYTSFLLLLVIGFFTENILDANKGIFFFAFFNTFFGYNIIRRRDEGYVKK